MGKHKPDPALVAQMALDSLNALRRLLALPEVSTHSLSALSLSAAQVRMLGRMGGVMGKMDASIRLCIERGDLAHAELVLREAEILATQAQAFRSDLLRGPAEVRVWRENPCEVPDDANLLAARAFGSMPEAMESVRGRGQGVHLDLVGQAKFLAVTVHHVSGWVAGIIPGFDATSESWFVVSPAEWPAWVSSLKVRAPKPVGGEA